MSESTATPEFDPVRADLRTAMAQMKISGAEAARRSGIAVATLSAFLAGTYNGRNDRVADDVRKWLGTLAERAETQARTLTLPGFVETPTAQAFLAALQHAQFVPDMVTITGAAGVGKTTACREYQRAHANVWLITGIPSASSTHAVLEMICAGIGVTENAANRRNAAIVRRVRGSEGLLVIDEAQHLASQALDELRSIHDAAGIGLALVGNESVFAKIDGGGRKGQFAQVFSRVGMRVSRNRPLRDDVEAMLDAAGVRDGGARKLLRVIAGKPGALRGMSKTLRVAHMLATEEGAAINEQHLSAAWTRLSAEDRIGEAG